LAVLTLAQARPVALQTWLSCLLTAIGLSLSPGPNGRLALTHGVLHGGARRGARTSAARWVSPA